MVHGSEIIGQKFISDHLRKFKLGVLVRGGRFENLRWAFCGRSWAFYER